MLASGSVGSGKTLSLVFKIIKSVLEHAGIEILVIGVTFPAMRDTILREFQAACPEELIKNHNKTSQTFDMFNGSRVLFRSFSDPLRIRSYTVGLIIFEELILIPELLFEEARNRLRQKGMPNQICAATNPGGYSSWPYKKFIGQQDGDGNLLPESKRDNRFHVVYSVSRDNKHLPKAYLEDLESLKITNPDAYKRLVLGLWGISVVGQIYQLPEKNRTELSQDKGDYDEIIVGVDFGFAHPSAFTVIGYNDEVVNVIDEVYRYNLVSGQIVQIAKELQQKYDVSVFYCDSARPELISDMVSNGLHALPAYKGSGSVVEGITYIKSLISDGIFNISSNCPYSLREIDTYTWKPVENNRSGDKSEEKPIKNADDCMDSIRYAVFTHKRESADSFELVTISPSSQFF